MRVVLYDRTCVVRRGALTPAWAAGGRLYRALGRIDVVRGVASWDDALGYLAAQREPIRELEFWGHGSWGSAKIATEPLDATALAPRHRLRAKLEAVRERLAPAALLWLRTCKSFGAARGLDFAQRLADFFGARVAGHTYIIGFHQSGLRALAPGMRARWSAVEGLAAGTAHAPERALWSMPGEPRTITCLHGAVPAVWI